MKILCFVLLAAFCVYGKADDPPSANAAAAAGAGAANLPAAPGNPASGALSNTPANPNAFLNALANPNAPPNAPGNPNASPNAPNLFSGMPSPNQALSQLPSAGFPPSIPDVVGGFVQLSDKFYEASTGVVKKIAGVNQNQAPAAVPSFNPFSVFGFGR